MDTIKKDGVAIIGAGLGVGPLSHGTIECATGTALALALHQKSIPCRIYEGRSADADILTSGVVLTPNGCRILDDLGVLSRIKPKSFLFEDSITKNSEDKTVDTMKLASKEVYGYPAYRLYRLALLQEMKQMLAEREVPIYFDTKFEKIISDSPEGVTFLAGGKTEKAAVVVGSDGIHSTLRRYLTDLVPVYTGVFCVYGHIPINSVNWPDKEFFASSCTIQGKPGSLFMVPEESDGRTLMVGTQFPHPEQGREGWQDLAASPESLASLMRKDYDQWHDTARRIIDQLCKRPEGLLSWPFYTMPRLPSWASPSGNVIIVGDAAHAMPASSGQGVNQALEDVYSLAKVLSGSWTVEERPRALGAWQSWRQAKIDKVLQMTRATNLKRSPEAERQKSTNAVDVEKPAVDRMRWLFELGLDDLEAKLADVDRHDA
ncbi:6-hydroxynicotinate 3-monooxygenase [Colletotrichum fructicola]|uniref:Kynurenine 3-monooxygenase n=1 Tax=Colletotrichum fructicola (strain Nara gc5) TaxID=1213859 RepID=L2FJG8_COLFN|nr:6-hydroxynicotinate 3-monooxygenase [Colletotrichum fructicola]